MMKTKIDLIESIVTNTSRRAGGLEEEDKRTLRIALTNILMKESLNREDLLHLTSLLRGIP